MKISLESMLVAFEKELAIHGYNVEYVDDTRARRYALKKAIEDLLEQVRRDGLVIRDPRLGKATQCITIEELKEAIIPEITVKVKLDSLEFETACKSMARLLNSIEYSCEQINKLINLNCGEKLTWSKLVGKRVLLKTLFNGHVSESLIVRVSLNGEHIKLTGGINGAYEYWTSVKDLELIEILK
jgi:hypothetical protein